MNKEKASQEIINELFDEMEKGNGTFVKNSLETFIEFDSFLEARKEITLSNGQKSTSSIDLYLASIFYNFPESTKLLISEGYDGSSVSEISGSWSNTFAPKSIFTKEELCIIGANDLCWAVMSDNGSALKNLLTTKLELDIPFDINARNAEIACLDDMSDSNYNKYTALDLAVMKYVAIKKIEGVILEAFNAADNNQILDLVRNMPKDRANQLSKIASEINNKPIMSVDKLSNIAEVFFKSGLPKNFNNNNNDFIATRMVEKNIWALLDNGAIGSDLSYFPLSEESQKNPFNCNDSFEILSLQEFCKNNSDLFSDDILNRITNGPSEIQCELSLKFSQARPQ